MLPQQQAYAATIKTLSSSGKLIPLDQCFELSKSNCIVKWNGVNGRTYTSGNNVDYCVPSKGSKGGWEYRDFVDFIFSGNKLAGKNITIKIHVDRYQVTTKRRKSSDTLPSQVPFACFDKDGFWFNGQPYSSSTRTVQFQWFVDYIVTITWNDSGKVISKPFFQVISDIDSGANYSHFKESWQPLSGFNDTFYMYDKSFLKNSGNRFYVPTSSDTIVVNGNESLTKAGVIATTTNGSFSGRIEGAHCGTLIQLFSNFTFLNNPSKAYKIQ